MIVVQLCRRIFRQTIQIEEARVALLPTKFVKYDGKDASKCAIKALAVHPAVLPYIKRGSRTNVRLPHEVGFCG